MRNAVVHVHYDGNLMTPCKGCSPRNTILQLYNLILPPGHGSFVAHRERICPKFAQTSRETWVNGGELVESIDFTPLR